MAGTSSIILFDQLYTPCVNLLPGVGLGYAKKQTQHSVKHSCDTSDEKTDCKSALSFFLGVSVIVFTANLGMVGVRAVCTNRWLSQQLLVCFLRDYVCICISRNLPDFDKLLILPDMSIVQAKAV